MVVLWCNADETDTAHCRVGFSRGGGRAVIARRLLRVLIKAEFEFLQLCTYIVLLLCRPIVRFDMKCECWHFNVGGGVDKFWVSINFALTHHIVTGVLGWKFNSRI